ncbi:LIC_11026 family protein [Leptospira interrogans]|uniref:Uncharacterized protein n=1 Tax=Leptospira interrogans serovar Pomona TaxID=44276 RepID=A0AA41BJG3_LEPIR|nr:hypothetical protein [Leptospira interrogans]MCD1184494.1 hypothetical protein [Leptospira sp. Pond_2020]ASV05852.1 hypothetical protein B2G47_07320 [Leptospira interrogans serovar Canicola]KGE27525.1 hypothetical protein IQ65_06200 [Leptospira interrogans serovar Lai]KYZ62470.1 hypothetical protein AWU66_11610 [Leptospira interrogans serovar Pomona]MBE8344817.1 hypothetical protein [Leptospira interrogans serovar Pomona]
MEIFKRHFQKHKTVYFFLLSLFIIYKLVFNRYTGQLLLPKILQGSIRGSANFTVTKFSLFYGIAFEDLVLKSDSTFEERPVLSVKELELSYNLPWILLGRAKLSKIAIVGLKIDLRQKSGEWNLSKLFPTSSQPSEEEKTSSSSLEEISTILPVSAYLNLELRDIFVHVSSEAGLSSYKAGLEGFSLAFELDTVRFRKIPLNVRILQLIDVIRFKMNPEKTVRIYFEDNSKSLDQPFRLGLELSRDLSVPGGVFVSQADIGADSIPIKVQNKLFAPFGFGLRYKLGYLEKEDKLKLENLELKVNEDVWLSAAGEMVGVSSKERNVQFGIQKSLIRLKPLSDFLSTIPGIPKMKLDGELSLAPITISGKDTRLKVEADIGAKDLLISIGGKNHKIPKLKLLADFILHPFTQETPNASKPVPILENLRLKELSLDYNGIQLSATGNILRGSQLDLDLGVQNLNLSDYVKTLNGVLGLKMKATGIFNSLNVDGAVQLSGFRFPMGRGKSSPIPVNLDLKSRIQFSKPFIPDSILLDSISISTKGLEGKESLKISSIGNLGLGKGFSMNLNSLVIKTELDRLTPTLPFSLRESLAPVRNNLGNQIILTGGLNYSIFEGAQSVSGKLLFDLPGIQIRDLRMDLNLKIAKDSSITLSNFDLTAFQSKFRIVTSGVLKKVPEGGVFGDLIPDLEGNIQLGSDKPTYLFKGINFEGLFAIRFRLKNSIASGTLISKNSNFGYANEFCPGEDCKLYRIEGLDTEFSFVHDLSVKTTRNLIDGNKEKFIRTYGRIPASNFTIKQIIGTHPSISGIPFDYVKPKNGQPGLSARIDYSENFLKLEYLKVFTLDGLINGKDILVNVGGGDPEKMEYSAVVQIKDIDLKQLLPPKRRSKIDDGKIKADLNVSGRNLADPIPNVNLFFSVFQIGQDFAKSAVNIFTPSNVFTDFIYNSYAVDKIEVELSKGLVYAVIGFKRSVLNTIINLENSQISQQRMPLANFLKRARSEVDTYR